MQNINNQKNQITVLVAAKFAHNFRSTLAPVIAPKGVTILNPVHLSNLYLHAISSILIDTADDLDIDENLSVIDLVKAIQSKLN